MDERIKNIIEFSKVVDFAIVSLYKLHNSDFNIVLNRSKVMKKLKIITK